MNQNKLALERDFLSMIDETVKYVCKVLDTEYCLILQYDESQQALKVLGGTHQKNKSIDIEPNRTWDSAHALRSGELLVIQDYEREQNYSKIPLMDKEVKSGANIPIRGSEGIHGVLVIYSDEKNYFDEFHQRYLHIISSLLGTIFDRQSSKTKFHNQKKQLEEKVKTIKKVQRDLLDTAINKDWELGKFLNEDLAQTLLASKIKAHNIAKKATNEEQAKSITELGNTLDKAVKDIGRASQQIIAVDTKDDGVRYTLEYLLSRIENEYNVNCTLNSSNGLGLIDSKKFASHLYRITKQALENVILNHDANNISIDSSYSTNKLCISIIDDGNLSSKSDDDTYRLKMLKHQCELLGGSLNSRAPTETQDKVLRLTFPIHQ